MHTFPVSAQYAHVKPEVIFSEHYGQILYYPECNVAYVEIIGVFTHMEYRRLYETLLAFIRKRQPYGCIASQAKSKGSSMQDRAWLVTSWFSQLKASVSSNFVLIGLREAHDSGAFKRWIADYLERTLSSMASFTVKSAPDFDAAVAFIQSRVKADLPT